MITAENIQVSYGSTTAVNRISLTVPDAGTLGLIGPNGSGKTTLLRALYGAEPLSSGRVLLNGVDLSTVRRQDIARTVAVVAQERDSTSTNGPMTVAELALLGRLPHRIAGSLVASPVQRQDVRSITEALDSVGMTTYARKDLSELSGGERQRALIARALAQEAHHVLLDEPTNHLDIHHQHEILELITSLPGSVVVLHDLNLAARYCDQIMVLDRGRVVASGTPEQVLVPEVLEPVYGVSVRRLEVEGEITLVFPRGAGPVSTTSD